MPSLFSCIVITQSWQWSHFLSAAYSHLSKRTGQPFSNTSTARQNDPCPDRNIMKQSIAFPFPWNRLQQPIYKVHAILFQQKNTETESRMFTSAPSKTTTTWTTRGWIWCDHKLLSTCMWVGGWGAGIENTLQFNYYSTQRLQDLL